MRRLRLKFALDLQRESSSAQDAFNSEIVIISCALCVSGHVVWAISSWTRHNNNNNNDNNIFYCANLHKLYIWPKYIDQEGLGRGGRRNCQVKNCMPCLRTQDPSDNHTLFSTSLFRPNKGARPKIDSKDTIWRWHCGTNVQNSVNNISSRGWQNN